MLPKRRLATHFGEFLREEFLTPLGTTPQFWTNLQSQYDLAHERPTRTIRRLRSTGGGERARSGAVNHGRGEFASLP